MFSARCRSTDAGARRDPPPVSSPRAAVPSWSRGTLADPRLRGRERSIDVSGQDIRELRGLGMGRRGGPRVVEHPGQILEVAALAVAVVEPRENADDLAVPLQPPPVYPT